MTNQQKQEAIIAALGSVQAYNKALWEKLPPDFYMYMDAEGNLSIPDGSIAEYLKREMGKGLTYEAIERRDIERFKAITDELYRETHGEKIGSVQGG